MAPLHAAPAPVPRRTRARVFAAFQIAAAKTTAKTLRYGLESRKETPAKPRTAKLPASRSARRVAARQDWQDRLAAVGAVTGRRSTVDSTARTPIPTGTVQRARALWGRTARVLRGTRGRAAPVAAPLLLEPRHGLCEPPGVPVPRCQHIQRGLCQPQAAPAQPSQRGPRLAGSVAAAQLVAGRRSRGGTHWGAGRRANTDSRVRRQALARACARAQALAGWLAGVLRLSQRCPRWLVCWRAHAYARALAIFGVTILQPKRSNRAMRNTK